MARIVPPACNPCDCTSWRSGLRKKVCCETVFFQAGMLQRNWGLRQEAHLWASLAWLQMTHATALEAAENPLIYLYNDQEKTSCQQSDNFPHCHPVSSYLHSENLPASFSMPSPQTSTASLRNVMIPEPWGHGSLISMTWRILRQQLFQ